MCCEMVSPIRRISMLSVHPKRTRMKYGFSFYECAACYVCVSVCVGCCVSAGFAFFFCLLLCRLLLSLVLAPRFGRQQKNREPAHRRRIKASVRLMDQLFSIFDYDFSNDTHSHLLKQISISKI